MTQIYVLDAQNDKLRGELNNRGGKIFRNDRIYNELWGEYSFEFEMPANIKESEYFEDRARILVPAEDGGYEEFIIYETSTFLEGGVPWKRVIAESSSRELDGLKIIPPATHAGLTLKQYAQLALGGTGWNYGTVDYMGVKTLTYDDYKGAFALLVSVAKEFDVELRYRTEVSGSRVIGRYIDIIERIGSNRRKEIEIGKDLVSVERQVHSGRIVTALLCIAPEAENGTQLTAFITDEDAYQRWARKDPDGTTHHIIGIYTPESDRTDMTLAQLEQYGRTELKKRIDSVVEYLVTAVDLEAIYPHERVRLGDSLRIKNPQFSPPLYAEARAIAVERSLTDPTAKSYVIGNVVTYTEADVMSTFRALQRLYGTKLVKSDSAPAGKPNTIWIDTSNPLNVPHTYNTATNTWEKFAPTDASEINGLVVGQQYNGVSITPDEGLKVTRTDGLVETLVNATEGFTIQSRPDDLSTFKKVFFADEFGDLTFAGIARGAQILIGGLNNEDGVLIVYGPDGIPVAELNSATETYNLPSLSVGDLYAPNVVPYADYRNESRLIYVAAESNAGISEPSDDNTGESWSSPLRTITEALRRIPLAFKGTVEILVAYGQVYNEDIEISGYGGGGTLIVRNSAAGQTKAKVGGSIRIISNDNFVEWRDVHLDTTDPYAGIFIRGTDGVINGVKINGVSGDTDNAINVNSGSSFEIYNVDYSNFTTAVRASYGGHAHVSNNTGSVSGIALVAFGGTISGTGTSPTGAGGDTSALQGGQITGSWTFPTPPAAPTPIGVTSKLTLSANGDSGTYRTDFGGMWDSGSNYGNYATQGKWGAYGTFTGAWFFDSTLPTTVSGKTIKSIRVYATRVSGGSGSAVSVKFRPHTNASRPSGNVSLSAPEYSVSFKPGESKWVTLPTSFHAGFASGSYKGIAVYSGTSNYAKLLKSAKIEITYQ